MIRCITGYLEKNRMIKNRKQIKLTGIAKKDFHIWYLNTRRKVSLLEEFELESQLKIASQFFGEFVGSTEQFYQVMEKYNLKPR